MVPDDNCPQENTGSAPNSFLVKNRVAFGEYVWNPSCVPISRSPLRHLASDQTAVLRRPSFNDRGWNNESFKKAMPPYRVPTQSVPPASSVTARTAPFGSPLAV